MRLPILLLTGLLGIVALGFLMLAGGRHLTGSDGATASAPVTVPGRPASMAPLSGQPGKAAPVKARQVAPEIVAPPELAPESLERAPPRAPLGDLALAIPPQPGGPGRRLLHRPVASAAGRLEAAGHAIELGGITPIEPERECITPGGPSWPCGMWARTAFRNWLRGRAVECVVAEMPAEQIVATECSLGGGDVALWLVENGFATAKPGSAYVEAGEKAAREGRGIFGPGPSATQP